MLIRSLTFNYFESRNGFFDAFISIEMNRRDSLLISVSCLYMEMESNINHLLLYFTCLIPNVAHSQKSCISNRSISNSKVRFIFISRWKICKRVFGSAIIITITTAATPQLRFSRSWTKSGTSSFRYE